MPECRQALPVAEYLAETEPELMFLVLGGHALDFRDEDGAVLLPCQVKVRSRWQAAAGFDSGVAKNASQLVLGVGVSPQAPFASAGSTLNGSRLPDSSVASTWL